MEVLRLESYEPSPVCRGYTDRVLRVDLGARATEVQALPPGFKEKWVGGRGYALKLIWEGTTADTRFDSPRTSWSWRAGRWGTSPAFPERASSSWARSPRSPVRSSTRTWAALRPAPEAGGLRRAGGVREVEEDLVLVIDGDAGTLTLATAPRTTARTTGAPSPTGTACSGT